MEPNFPEINFRSSRSEVRQAINSCEANERRLSSEPFPSDVEKGRVAEIDQHSKKLAENTSAPSLPMFGSSTDKRVIPYNVLSANVDRPTVLSQESEKYTMRSPQMPSRTGVPFHEDREHDNVPSTAQNPALSLSDHIRKLSDSTHYEPVQLKPRIAYKIRSNFEIVDNINDSPSFGPTVIETEPVAIDGRSGCKPCNCKKTQCLKLYCQCFHHGVYCSDSCACEDCSNKSECEEVVHKAKKMILSRNPRAFSPKISGPLADNSGEHGGNHHTVASASHIRGCNCRKSKCSKKYCECYQSHVGCSDRCRCEGCENVHGQKGVSIMNKNLVSNLDSNKIITYNERANDNLLHNQFGDLHPHQMTLSTPSIPFSNHGETAFPHISFRPSYEPPHAHITRVPYHQSSSGMVMNDENHINNGVRFDGQLQFYGSLNLTESRLLGVPVTTPALLHHPLNSANNCVANSSVQSKRTRLLEGENSNSESNFESNFVNSLIQSEGTEVLEGDNSNSANNYVNSWIQSEGTEVLEGNSSVGRFSSSFTDGIPNEESAPPPNKAAVSSPLEIRSPLGLKLTISLFNLYNAAENQENKNPNVQQNYSRQDDNGQY